MAEDIKRGHFSRWNQEDLSLFNKLVLDESLVKEVLTLDRCVPEAVISEDEEEEPSLTAEAQLQIKPKQCTMNKKLTNLTQHSVPSVEGN